MLWASRGVSKLTFYDEGLQPERTFLSWKRTLLLLAVASAVGARLTFEQNGLVALVGGAALLAAASLSYILVNRRYAAHSKSLKATQSINTGGTLMALVAFSMILLSLFAMWFLVS